MKQLLAVILLVTISITAHAYQPCDPIQQSTMLLHIQCDVNNLQYEKLTLVDKSKNDPNKYTRQHANAMVSFTELKIQNRKSIIAGIKNGSIDSQQAGQILLDMMDKENTDLNGFYAMEQQGLESAMSSQNQVNEVSYPKPTPQKDLDITCVKQRDFAGSVRCKQN